MPMNYAASMVVYTLGKIGPEAKAAVPSLIELLKDQSESIRISSSIALGNIGPEVKVAIPELTNMCLWLLVRDGFMASGLNLQQLHPVACPAQ